MSVQSALAIYFVIWWTVIFAVLPWGMRTQEEQGDVVPGTSASAPYRMRFLRIALINSVIAGLIFAAFYWLLTSGYKLDDFPLFKPPV